MFWKKYTGKNYVNDEKWIQFVQTDKYFTSFLLCSLIQREDYKTIPIQNQLFIVHFTFQTVKDCFTNNDKLQHYIILRVIWKQLNEINFSITTSIFYEEEMKKIYIT